MAENERSTAMLFDINDQAAREVVSTYLRAAREEGKSIGLASGSFDLIHFQHVLFLTRCRRMCDILIVGVDSDELVRERKGNGRPIIYDSRRVVMVDAMKAVTFAFIMRSIEDFGKMAALAKPDVIFKNDAFLRREHDILGREHAGRIEIVRDVVEHSSTTDIIRAVARESGMRHDG
jgi:D-beta-D-heptose 7-phosphate kinase/D-beta-D-heptose 1-phosphate adenosyltransferase